MRQNRTRKRLAGFKAKERVPYALAEHQGFFLPEADSETPSAAREMRTQQRWCTFSSAPVGAAPGEGPLRGDRITLLRLSRSSDDVSRSWKLEQVS